MGRKRKIVAVVDCETDPFEAGRFPQPFAWGFYDGLNYIHFWGDNSTERMAHFLREKDCIAYAHNGGKFDWHFLAPYFERGQRMQVINGRISDIKLGECRLRDSWNLIPVPLAVMEKEKIDYAKFERHCRENYKQDILDYLRSDCVHLWDYLSDYFSRLPASPTMASASMAMWRRISGEKNVPQSTRRYHHTLKPFYRGGRCQAFKKGIHNGDYKCIDINSAYPRAMLESHPYGLNVRIFKRQDIAPLDGNRRFYRFTGFSEGAIPITQSCGGLSFPNGYGEFMATDWEVVAGLETNTLRINRISKVFEFTDCRDFGAYINEFYAQKLHAERTKDKAGRLFAKLFMNSLYGKFAANPTKYREYLIEEPGYSAIEDDEGDWTPGPILGPNAIYWRPLPRYKHRYYNIATAASITGYVRAFLWRSIQRCNDVLYCDTDSIICRGFVGLEIGDKLGQWSVEAEADKIAIAGKKLYAAWQHGKPVKRASKGVRLTPAEIENVAKGQEITYNSIVPSYSIARELAFTNRTIKMGES